MERYRFSDSERMLLEQLPTPLAVYQFVGRHVYTLALSDGFREMFGYEDKAEAYRLMNEDPCHNMHPDDVARINDAIRRFIADSGKYEVIFRGKENHGEDYRIVHGIGRHVYKDGARLAYVAFTDEGTYTEEGDTQPTALSQAFNTALHEESILKANYFDYLTGLPSMTYFFALAEAEKGAIAGRGGQPALLYLDISGMKYYNHKNGFAEGDKLLRAFARTLTRFFSNENCCRLSADHFAAFADEAALEDTLPRLFGEWEAACAGASLPVRVGVYPMRLEDVSISIACDRAKIACDTLRSTYVSGFAYYNFELRKGMKRHQYIQANLDNAIREKWIQVYYQPIVRAATAKVCDVEALARWIDPVEGFLSPAEFIPILEDSKLIYKLDLYMLEQVLEKMERQAAAGVCVVPHSVNLSRADFDACDIVEEIRRRVDAAGVARNMISIEITESVIGRDFEFMKDQIGRFQRLGFPVWMDDFGSGYSSLDVLQSIQFDLIKFDMGFMRKLDEGDNAKIILTELMKMATQLDVDTVCEGVETESQVRFLQEIGCSKLQGYYFSQPVSEDTIVARRRDGFVLEPENPLESVYNETIGRVNLYDVGMIANTEDSAFQNAFNTLPMGIIEIKGDKARFLRSNPSYRDFIKRFFGIDLTHLMPEFVKFNTPFMSNVVKTCCDQGVRAFFDEKMPDGSVIHSFARRIGANPATGAIAIAVAVLSVSERGEGETYADIARALAADYYNIYVVDLDTDRFIEYSSPVGTEEMAMERRGEDFFESSKRDAHRIYEEDRETFFAAFSKAQIIQALDQHGVFTATYRLVDTGTPVYVNMKVTRMQPGSSRIIMGISIIDSQMKQRDRDSSRGAEADRQI